MNHLRADFDFGGFAGSSSVELLATLTSTFDMADTLSAELLGATLTANFSFPVGPAGLSDERFVVSSITVSSIHQLTAARNQRVLVNSTNVASGAVVYLPASRNAEGDRLEVACVGLTSGALSIQTGQYDFTVSTSMGLNEQRTLIYTSGAWTVGTVESHTHSGLGPTFASSKFRVTEPSGLATNQLAFSLANITAGHTRTLTVPDASGTIALTSNTSFIINVTTSQGNVNAINYINGAGGLGFTSSSAARYRTMLQKCVIKKANVIVQQATGQALTANDGILTLMNITTGADHLIINGLTADNTNNFRNHNVTNLNIPMEQGDVYQFRLNWPTTVPTQIRIVMDMFCYHV